MILIMLLLLICISSLSTVSANEDNSTDLESVDDGIAIDNNDNDLVSEVQEDYVSDDGGEILPEVHEYYVSPDGDDFTGNGTYESPFSSIGFAVNIADDNSRIIIKDGTYKGTSNTGVTINKNLIIEAESPGKVSINGENKYWFFKVNSGSSVVLNNLKFVNGRVDSYTQLAVIYNAGDLLVNNSSLNNMRTVMGTFFNEGTLILDNTNVTNSYSSNMAQILTNVENATVMNSKFTTTIAYSPDIDVTVYNYKNLNIQNSNIGFLQSNCIYDEYNYVQGSVLINNSVFSEIEIENTTCNLFNSRVNGRGSFKGSDAIVDNTKFISTTSLTILSIFDSNFTATHSVFDYSISTGYSDINITYSVILSYINGGGKSGYLYAPYNWWGSNEGPSFNYFRNYYVKYWAVATFDSEDGNLSVGTNSKFIASLNKWTDGNSTYDFEADEYLPSRYITFESQNGRFLYSSANLYKTFGNYLLNNILDCMVYCVIDNQRLALTIGNGLSEYTYFVAPDGHDGPDDGTMEKPFWSLTYALKMAGNGNTICLLEGLHKNNADSDLTIDKNITIVGLGDVTLRRANAFNIFKIKEWGSLTVKNIKFAVDVREYDDSIFVLTGGNLTIFNCNFTAITSSSLILTDSGNVENGIVIIENCHFDDIIGSVSTGTAQVYVRNSIFEHISNFYHIQGFENYNSVFPITSSIEIYDSIFRDNSVGIVNLHPFTYSSNSYLGATYSEYHYLYNRYAYIKNTTFENNIFKSSSYSSSGIGLNIYDDYGSYDGFIENCTFTGNAGKIAIATNVENSSFYNNRGEAYNGEALVTADFISNCEFISNVNQYINYDDAYIGEGIASANLILSSTFINNRASFGGAVSSSKSVHYCVFVNNTAKYSGNDIYSSSGDVDYSSNWWGDNQKPTSDNIFIFLGSLTLNDWVIMTFESISGNVVEASLNKLIDDNGFVRPAGYNLPVRPVYFSIEGGSISPSVAWLSNNCANATLCYDENASDLKVYAQIDNQILDLDVKNSNTNIIMENITIKGKDYDYDVYLVNVNGYKIFNQTLVVDVIDSEGVAQKFNIVTDENGHAVFNIDFPVGRYVVNVNYLGNGFFDKCNNSATIEVLGSATSIVGYDETYYGKNNKYIVTLYGEEGRVLKSYPVRFTIIDSNGVSNQIDAVTDYYGQAQLIFSLDIGNFTIKSEYLGDSWYTPSSIERTIVVYPANSTLIVPNATLYGQGCTYDVILKDCYGSLIRDENVIVTISQGSAFDRFILKTDDYGRATLTINYNPGTYNVKAEYKGDNVYGPSVGYGVIHVEKVLTIVSGFHYTTIPLNGIYTVVLTDMYGRRVNNETITLNCYKGSLIKSYQGNTDPNGEVSFVIDLDEGSYLVTYDYDGNEWYDYSTNAATVVVSKDAILQNIQINATDLIQYYGENKFFIIEFNDPNAYSQYGKKIQVTLSSGEWSQSYEVVTDAFGLARLKINLNPGEYNITYKYSNYYYNIFGSGSNTILVYKMPSTILGKDVIMKLNETRVYEISLRNVNNNAIKNMQVHVDINGTDYDIATNNEGIARLLLDLGLGKYDITYTFNNPNYLPAEGSSTILVVDSDKISSFLSGSDMDALDNQTIRFTASLLDSLDNGMSGSEITLQISTFEGQPIRNLTKFTNKNGIAIFEFDLEAGKYVAKLKYAGDDLHLQSSSVNTINVNSSDNKIKTILFLGETRFKNSTFYVVLADVNGTLLVNKTVTFYIGNEQYSTKTDSQGRAYLRMELDPNVYTVNIVFNGDDYYKKVSSYTKLFISGDLTELYVSELVKYYRNGTQFHARLVDGEGNSLVNKTVLVVLENVTYECLTDENGWITLKIDLKPGSYDVECYYYGKNDKENSFNQTTITVLSTIVGSDEVRYYGVFPYLSIYFLDGAGDLIRNTQFVIGIDGTNYIAMINSAGVFNFNLNLASGSHVITVTNPYDGLTASYNLEILPTILVNKIIKLLGDGKYYSASFLDKNGSVLANTEIDVIIDGIKYVYKTDVNGKIKINMELAPNDYLVTVINPKTGEYIENTISVYAPICENKDLVMYYNSGACYKVKIIGSNGRPVGAGVSVKFTVANKVYTVKTDKNGVASLKITLMPNKYVVVVRYNNYKVSNKITVKSTLTAKDIKVKKGKTFQFTAKLVNGKGKPLNGKQITFKIKNKIYKSKTNKNGIAAIKIPLKLKAGKYGINTIYGKLSVKNTITITPVPVLSAKNVKVKKGKAIKFKAKLVGANGKPLKGKKITFKIKGKTYKSKTNKKGVATVKIKLKLKAGKYPIKTSYSDLSIKNKITIKK